MESLEDRIAPASLVFHAEDSGNLLLRGGEHLIEIVDTGDSTVRASGPRAEVDDVRIFGEGFDVSLQIGPGVAELPGGVRFEGGSGTDRLVGPAGDTEWRITGVNSGQLGIGGWALFTGVENLEGAADNQDHFAFTSTGSLGGTVAGGDRGFDTVELDGGSYGRVEFLASGPDSGTIRRDADAIVYVGMEPITSPDVNAAEIVFNGTSFTEQAGLFFDPQQNQFRLVSTNEITPTFETVFFNAPSKSLTINLDFNAVGTTESLTIGQLGTFDADLIIDGQGGPDKVVFRGDLDLNGHHLFVKSEVIEVNAHTITAGDITFLAEGDEAALSVGSNLPLDIVDVIEGERRITISPGANIAGNTISMQANRITTLASPLRPFGGGKKETRIEIDGATITGGDVTIAAAAEDQALLDQVPDWAQSSFTSPLTAFLFDGIFPPIPFGVMIRGGEATVSLNDTHIVSTGNVTVGSTVVVDSSTAALGVTDAWTAPGSRANSIYQKLNHLSVGYSQADGTARTTLTGTSSITADGDVTVSSDTATTAAVTARTTINASVDSPADTNALGASIAVVYSTTDSETTLGSGTLVDARGNVNLLANGSVTNSAKSGVSIYIDGKGGLGVAIGVEETNVTATADGTIIAGGTKVSRDLVIADVDGASDTIKIPGHGLKPGQEVVYLVENQNFPADPKPKGHPIGGLLHGETLRVVVIDQDHIQLVREGAIEIDATTVNANATHQINPRQLLEFDPEVAVDDKKDEFTVTNHGFQEGQLLDYAVITPGRLPIGNLVSSTSYLALNVSQNTFRVADEADPATPLSLTAPESGTTHAFGFTAAGPTFDPSTAVDNVSHEITLNGHGFQTGDEVIYRADDTIQSETVVRRTAFISPVRVTTFDPSAMTDEDTPRSVVDTAADTIVLLPLAGVVTGQRVTYYPGEKDAHTS